MQAERLKEFGIDAEAGMARFMDDEELYCSILALFPDDEAFVRATADYEKKDYNALFRSAHELKGVSGNTALTALFAASSELVEYLRAGGRDEKEVDALFAAVNNAYRRALEGIALANGCA